jgi:hypothetical protein
MKNLNCVFPGLALAALLTACGGSDDNGGGGAGLDKYLGSWTQCVSTGGTSSERETLLITQGTGGNLAFTDNTTAYAGSGCTGTITSAVAATGTLAFTGTKTIGGETVDKAIISAGAPEKQVLLVRGAGTANATLTPGLTASEGGVLDADGYPTALSATAVFSKQ